MFSLRYFRQMPHPFKSGTLRRTLVIYLLIACLFPPIMLTMYTYSSLHSILTTKISSGIEASLKQEATGLENVLNNLDFVSKQLALDGQIVNRMNAYLNASKVSDKSEIMSNIEESLNVINFTNPYLGLTVYYMPDAQDPILFTNLAMNTDFHVDGLPSFVHYRGAEYYGPHKTQYKNSSNTVFSSVRVVRTNGKTPVYIYMETNYNLFRKLVSNEFYGMKVSHFLLGDGEEGIYADEGVPPFDIKSLPHGTVLNGELYQGYYLFGYESPQGWRLVTAVDRVVFNSEIDAWIRRIALLFAGSFLFAIVLASIIWRKVYGSLRKVNREIVRTTGDREAPVRFIGVEEFDQLLSNFQVMKKTVNGLIDEISWNERAKSRLETEKVLSQINPHFLHNTLNTVQWMARANQQPEIDRVVTLLVKLLQYNLGKQSPIVTVREEVEALQYYIDLQRFRYEDELDFTISVDPEAEDVPIPRFLLQPILENAIYHGKKEENGQIKIAITNSGVNTIVLVVSDNGAGMAEETLQKLLAPELDTPKGMGIGLRYVKRLLNSFYGEGDWLSIRSQPGEGTVLIVEIPIKNGGELHDQGVSSR